MYKTRKRIVIIGVNIVTIVHFIIICLILLPERRDSSFSEVTFLVCFVFHYSSYISSLILLRLNMNHYLKQ